MPLAIAELSPPLKGLSRHFGGAVVMKRTIFACVCALGQLGLLWVSSPAEASVFDYESRIKANQRIIQQEPGSANAEEAYLEWGDLASEAALARYSEAASAYEGLLQHFPESKFTREVTFYLAYVNHYYLYDYKKALLYYGLILKKYRDLKFTRPDYYKNVAFISLTIEDIRRSAASIVQLIQTAEEFDRISTTGTKGQIISAADNLARLYRNEKNYDKAIGLYTRIVENAEDADFIQDAMFNIGDIFLTSIPEFRREYYNSTINVQEDVNASLGRGISAMRGLVDRFPRGRRAARALLEIAKAYMNVSVEKISEGSAEVGHYIMGDFPRAEETLKTAINDYPNSEIRDEALFRLGQVYESEQIDGYNKRTYGMRRFKEAVAVYQQLVREYPGSAYTDRAKERISAIGTR